MIFNKRYYIYKKTFKLPSDNKETINKAIPNKELDPPDLL